MMPQRKPHSRIGAAGSHGGILLIGVGNEFRTDDALGLLVAREFRRRSPAGVRVLEESGEGASLMEAWKGAERVIIIDAIASGEPPGSVHRIDAMRTTIPKRFFRYSSHAFGVAEAVEMARELDALPPMTVIYGVEGQSFEAGNGLSDVVVKSLPSLIHMIESDLRTPQCDTLK